MQITLPDVLEKQLAHHFIYTVAKKFSSGSETILKLYLHVERQLVT